MTAPAGSATRLLVVDDHLDLAENIADILSGAGFETAIAGSAEEALVKLETEPFDGVITDFRLPGLSGAEFIAELRRRGNRVPAVVMSAYTDDETIATACNAGAVDVLSKPVSIPRLMQLVEAIGRHEPLVLIVDDNRALADDIAEALESRGYEAVVSTTASEALAITAHPRAAIVDYRLPDASGVELAERLTSRSPSTHVLFVSGYPDEMKGALRGALADAPTLTKPVKIPELLDWVAATIARVRRGE